jgi:hypothetical protein
LRLSPRGPDFSIAHDADDGGQAAECHGDVPI